MHEFTDGPNQALQAVTEYNPEALFESLALKGDLSGLSPQDKVAYYKALCERLRLDPATQPFLPLELNGKVILYASKSATDQLARVWNIDRTITDRQMMTDAGVYVVTVRAELPNGRSEDSTGAVAIAVNKQVNNKWGTYPLQGEQLANALMKAETKAKRRAVLSILGLGMLDESEVEAIPESRKRPSEFGPARTPVSITPKPAPVPDVPADPTDPAQAAAVLEVQTLARELNAIAEPDEPKWTKSLILEYAEHRTQEKAATIAELSTETLRTVIADFRERLQARASSSPAADPDADAEREAIQDYTPEADQDHIATTIETLASGKQLGLIRSLARGMGIDPEVECRERFGCGLQELSKGAASQFIDILNKTPR